MSIELSYDKDGNIEINNTLSKRYKPVTLSTDEETAVTIILNIISNVGISNDNIHLERGTASYLSVVIFDVYDFCRIKIGQKSKWFSILMDKDCCKLFSDDERLSVVSNKNQLHWKIPLSTVNDLNSYADIIQRSYCNIGQNL